MATLQEYMQACAGSRDMGGFIPFTATSTSATSTSTKEIVYSGFIDDSANISNRYGNAWVYGTSDGTVDTLAGVQRQLRRQPLDGTTGTVYTAAAFASTPQSGQGWEMYFGIPPIRDLYSGRDGWRELINEALSLMAVTDYIVMVGVSNQPRYQLNVNTHPYLRERSRIRALWRPTPNSTDLERVDVQDKDIIYDGEKVILQVHEGYTTGEMFKIEVERPANSRLFIDGAWIDQTSPTAGLVNAADEAIPAVQQVVLVVRELAFADLASRAPEAEARLWLAREAKARAEAAWAKWTPRERAEPMRFVGDSMGAAL